MFVCDQTDCACQLLVLCLAAFFSTVNAQCSAASGLGCESCVAAGFCLWCSGDNSCWQNGGSLQCSGLLTPGPCPSCTNGKKDQDETDIDCVCACVCCVCSLFECRVVPFAVLICGPCEVNQKCYVNKDCDKSAGLYCLGGSPSAHVYGTCTQDPCMVHTT